VRRQPISFRWLVARVALFIVVGATRVGAAEDLEHAREVFHEALVLEVAGDWASALAKFQEVGRTRLTPQVRYHLARCKEHLGRLTEALGDYRVAEVEARAAGLTEWSEMERACRNLEVRVPTLLLRGGGTSAAFHIELDGIVLGNAVIDRPMVLNPGQHQVTLRGPQGASRVLLIMAEEGKRLEVDLREYDQNLVSHSAPNLARPEQRVAPTWAYVAVGTGAAAVAASVVLFIVRKQAEDELAQNCVKSTCPDNMRSVQERGELVSKLAPVVLGVGIAGIGLGAWGLLWGTRGARVSRGKSTSSTVSAAAWPGGWGVNVVAKF
jgi:hypothetical protein